MPEAEIAEHLLAAQVQVAILEAQLLVRLFVVMERRRLGAVQNLEFLCQHLDVAGGHVGVDRALGPLPDLALHRQHELAANPLRLGEDIGAVRVENDLQQAFAVA